MSVYASKEIPFRKEWIVNDKHLLLSNTGWRYRISDFRKTKDAWISKPVGETKITNFLFNNPV